ncbi:hypothetical protein BGZ80_005164, partial [Entomortierella chlamydospora]
CILAGEGSQPGSNKFEGQTKWKELGLKMETDAYELWCFIPLIKASPNLEVLEFPRIVKDKIPEVTEAIAQSCPKLRDIDLEKLYYGFEDNYMVDIINTCKQSGLRRFILSRYGFVLPKWAAAICSYTTTLEIVKIAADGIESVAITLHLLRSCTNMRIIETFTSGLASRDFGRFTAKGLLKEPWVCLGLETLSIPIIQVHNIDIAESPDEKYDYQMALYSQISQLTRLSRLNLGFRCKVKIDHDTSLLFSLKSGLDTLAGLKSMRVLDLHHTTIKLYREELEWMCDNWPLLERVNYKRWRFSSEWWMSTREVLQQSSRARVVIEDKIRKSAVVSDDEDGDDDDDDDDEEDDDDD